MFCEFYSDVYKKMPERRRCRSSSREGVTEVGRPSEALRRAGGPSEVFRNALDLGVRREGTSGERKKSTE